MVEHKQGHHPMHKLTLYVCSGCEGCDQATAFKQGWANGRQNVALEIVTIPEEPKQFVRLGITHTPALAINDELLAQKVSVESLAEFLRTRLNGPEVSP